MKRDCVLSCVLSYSVESKADAIACETLMSFE